MNIETTFSCGDKGFVYHDRIEKLTIGKVVVEVTDSEGDQDTIFDNYKSQSGYVEKYMCVETGIGSGSIYTLGEGIFVTEQECIKANEEYIAKKARIASERKAFERKRLLDSEASIRRQLEAIEAAKAEVQP